MNKLQSIKFIIELISYAIEIFEKHKSNNVSVAPAAEVQK